MIPRGLFTQILLVAMSFGIIFTYLKPEFTSISETQNTIRLYQMENAKVKEVNDELDRQVSILENLSNDDNRRLLTYMPDEVDPIAVMRDLQTIAQDSGVILSGISDLGEAGADSGEALYFAETYDPYATQGLSNKKPSTHMFSISFEGSYTQIKALLYNLEQNHYPLVVEKLNIDTTEGGFLSVIATINAYAFINKAEEMQLAEEIQLTENI